MRSKVVHTSSEVESRKGHLGGAKLNKLEREDLLHLVVEIQLSIIDKIEQRKELERSVSKVGIKSATIRRDISSSSCERGLDTVISEWFGGNPKGKINKESFAKYSSAQDSDKVLNQTYFRRKPNFWFLEDQKKGTPSLRSHEGIGLDVAARAIMSEYITSPGESSESNNFHEQMVIEAIVSFMQDNPAGPASFRRKLRERTALENHGENGELVNFIQKEALPQINAEIKELGDFNAHLLKNCTRGPDDKRAIIRVLEFFNRVGRERPQVQNEMLRTFSAAQKNTQIQQLVERFLEKGKDRDLEVR